MARYIVKFACGHEEPLQLYGPHADRERYQAWAARAGRCSACRAQDAAAAREALEAEYGLPELKGTDRQIEWARQIRADLVGKVNDYLESVGKQVTEHHRDLYLEHCAIVRQQLMGKNSARWWIDNRHKSAPTLAADLYQEARG